MFWPFQKSTWILVEQLLPNTIVQFSYSRTIWTTFVPNKYHELQQSNVKQYQKLTSQLTFNFYLLGSRETFTYSIVEVIIQAKNMVLVSRVVLIDILEKLYLIKALIKKILVVLYDLYTNIHASMQVMCLNSFAECSRSKILSNMIPTSYH